MATVYERFVTLVASGCSGGPAYLLTPKGEKLRIVSAKFEQEGQDLGKVTVTMYGRVGSGDGKPESRTYDDLSAWRSDGAPCPACGSTAKLNVRKILREDGDRSEWREKVACLACMETGIPG